MTDALNGKTIAILATDGVEQRELSEPRSALDDAGADTRFIAPHHGLIRAWDQDRYGGNFVADAELKNARVQDYDALVLPGDLFPWPSIWCGHFSTPANRLPRSATANSY